MNYFDYQNRKQTPIRVETSERLSLDDHKTLHSLVAGAMLADMEKAKDTLELEIYQLALEGELA